MDATNTLTAAEQDAGFRLLFDGRSTAGWRGYGQADIFPQWRAVDGALAFHPEPKPTYGHDIISADAFGSFELRIEWKLWEKGNSGIMYHVREVEDRPHKTGPEFQLLDDDRHADSRNGGDRLTGACYALYPPEGAVPSPIGEWNETRIIVDGDRVEHHLNGRKIVVYTLGSDDWNARIVGSKFADWPEFARVRSGHICLQDHTNPVAFRNIRIRAW